MDLFNPAFWEDVWGKASDADEARQQGNKVIEAWNQRAKNYDQNTGTDSGQERVQAALDFLDSFGVLDKELRILDIGCGPGHFAVALARRGHTVHALDPAEKMLGMLGTKITGQPELETRINPVHADWKQLELRDFGWDGHFDLVFASMTPGIHGVNTLIKAMQASAGFVYLSRFSGPRLMPSLDAVWRALYGTSYYSRSHDIFFPLNWLYTSGYRPAVKYSSWEREHRQTREEAVQEMLDILSTRTEINRQVEEAVHARVAEVAQDGLVVEKKGATAAMLLWRTDKKIL